MPDRAELEVTKYQISSTVLCATAIEVLPAASSK
jgi:hypothetical protein